ncbi:hypothetical protein OGAPHI_005814 [Ogataea philodendri]|uniref:Major facilitator superfamily (MFS) profile domain-containing protein n=1 Tax=Ogataea philodendri TaxID=1378263 RepID=A0A9P8P0E8_9ASCO|nr:uncharacterized protein OGAPHI_005814 [Ogataea philodendri]KAH3662562.1 hypothetical protein OGAPHI_005814 [Ogataea philodendri]
MSFHQHGDENDGLITPEAPDQASSAYGSTKLVDEEAVVSKPGLPPNFVWIELSLFANVFLSGFDGTVTASTYATIGNEFKAANTASWITSSYLITSTAFQPLYGSFSDVLGRRACLMGATGFFIVGCLGCGLSSSILMLDFFRAITGIGGGGLVTLATIVNSDIIAPEKRGNWQAFQNLLLGFGSICGASLGGVIADTFGWRWCFLFQVPVALAGILVGHHFIHDPKPTHFHLSSHALDRIDINGSVTLVLSLAVQMVVLSLGGNELGWNDYRLQLLFILSLALLALFVAIELKTSAVPIIPPVLLHGAFSYIILGIGVLVGISSYAYLFILPLLFQIVLGDTASHAGLRLTIPSLFTPVGGLIAGYFMSRGKNVLFSLVTAGCALMLLGNTLALFIDTGVNKWLVGLCLVPANVGQGMIFPSSLFSFIYNFDKQKQAISTSTAYLFRSIGSVWGVTGSAAIIQRLFVQKTQQELANLPELSKKQIATIVHSVSKDISVISSLRPEIRAIVVSGYSTAIKRAQLVSCLCCLLCLVLAGLKKAFRVRSRSSYD